MDPKAAIELGVQMAEDEARYMLALRTQQFLRKFRDDLTPEQRERALKIGRLEFTSAGATRKR